MRILITGITGFVGSHLAELFLNRGGVQVFGAVRWRSKMANILHIEDRLTLVECDIKDGLSVRKMIEQIMPDQIYHLAAQSFVPTSWHAPTETISTNILGTLNVFEAVRALGINPKILVACTSEEYGMVYEHELPVTEENQLRPMSPYAVSKASADLLSYQYYMSYKLPIVRTRAFNHTGPRRGEVFASSNFAKQIAEIEVGKRPAVVHVGNLKARRDFTDVRDIVQGYSLALEKGVPGEAYVLASGKSYAIQEILQMLLGLAGVKVEIQEEPARMRPSDVPHLLGDAGKFREQTGWTPQIPLKKTLEDLLNYWREQVGTVRK
ncbi:MAG: GDP-mannose 4,6-dehydratase [Terriglobia bacterium]|jgi:GDP-4-dehydro-6-deoxy-D-mannose reductase